MTLYPDPAARRERGDIALIPTLSGSNSEEGRVFVAAYGVGNNTEAFLSLIFPGDPAFQQRVLDAYPIGSPGLSNGFDVSSAVFTDLFFQCGEALFANASAAAGYPAWRYYFNATFPNLQTFPNAGVYHSSEIGLVFGTYPRDSSTAQEYWLSNLMQGIWAGFAKAPMQGPEWVRVGSAGEFAQETEADQDVGVIGREGVRMARQSQLDARCRLYAERYRAVLAAVGTS